MTNRHELSAFYQNDRTKDSSNRELDNKPYLFNSTGGGLAHAKINSVWTNQMTSSFSVSYNDKRGNDKNTYDGVDLNGPQSKSTRTRSSTPATRWHRRAGPAQHARSDLVVQRAHLADSRRPDLLQAGLGGGHEFRAGIWAAPSMVRETVTEQVNSGFGLQRDR